MDFYSLITKGGFYNQKLPIDKIFWNIFDCNAKFSKWTLSKSATFQQLNYFANLKKINLTSTKAHTHSRYSQVKHPNQSNTVYCNSAFENLKRIP